MSKRKKKAVSIEKAAARQSKTASEFPMQVASKNPGRMPESSQANKTTSKPETPDETGFPDADNMTLEEIKAFQDSGKLKHRFQRPEAGPMTPALEVKHKQIVAGAMDMAAAEEQCLPTEKELLTSEDGVLKIPESKETTSVTTPGDQKSKDSNQEIPEPPQGFLKKLDVKGKIAFPPNRDQIPASTIDPRAATTDSFQELAGPKTESPPPSSEQIPDSKFSEDYLKELMEFEEKEEELDVRFPVESLPKEQKPAEEDPALTRIKRYFGDGHYVHGTAAGQVTAICANPSVMAPTTQWGQNLLNDLPKMLTGILMQAGYLDNIWPQLKLVMGTSVGNVQWAVQIASSIAFFDLLKVLSHPGMCAEG